MASFKGRLKYLALFALSAWMFFMGVLVGRGTAPVEFDTQWFQNRLAVIFEASREEEVLGEKPELDFYAALKANDRDVEFDVNTGGEGNAAKGAEDEPGITGNVSEPLPMKKSRKAMTVALQLQKSLPDRPQPADMLKKVPVKTGGRRSESPPKLQAPVMGKERRNLPGKGNKSSEIQRDSDTIYTIQIASYLNEKDALNHIAQLKSKGYRAYKNMAKVNDKIWFRVRIGSFDMISKARTRLQTLEKERVKGLIIQKE